MRNWHFVGWKTNKIEFDWAARQNKRTRLKIFAICWIDFVQIANDHGYVVCLDYSDSPFADADARCLAWCATTLSRALPAPLRIRSDNISLFVYFRFNSLSSRKSHIDSVVLLQLLLDLRVYSFGLISIDFGRFWFILELFSS